MVKRDWKPKDPKEAFFPVEMRHIFMENSGEGKGYTKLKRHFAVVDIENNNPFSVVTDDYQLVTNEEAYNKAAEIMQQVFQVTTMEDMACLNITMPGTRSFCHIDLVHKSADFSPWEKDKWTAFLRITNSYNRTRLLRFELGFCRWICLNGMIFGNKSIDYSFAHTRRGVDRVDRIENIQDIRKLEVELTEKLHQLKRYYVPEAAMLAILCKAFDITVTGDVVNKPKRVEGLVALREKTKELTKSYFSEMGPHGYAALNVLTDYALNPEDAIAPEASMHSYQQKCGNWMDSFVSAIKLPSFSFDKYLEGHHQSAEVIQSL